VNSYAEIQLQQAQERIRSRIEEASIERLAASSRPPSRQSGRRSIRRSIGYSFIRIGERLAEPQFRPARSP